MAADRGQLGGPQPRPAHTWREFLSEITVVVLGVVIALSAEQMLQRLEVRSKVRHAEQQMREEIANDARAGDERLALATRIGFRDSERRRRVSRLPGPKD